MWSGTRDAYMYIDIGKLKFIHFCTWHHLGWQNYNKNGIQSIWRSYIADIATNSNALSTSLRFLEDNGNLSDQLATDFIITKYISCQIQTVQSAQ